LAQPLPNRTYRSRIDLTETPATPVEQIIRLAATLLGLLVLLRFVTNLLTVDRANGWVNFINTATDWIVRPFQGFIPQPTINSGGVLDWPAISAAIVVAVLAALLVRLVQPRHT
jgi:uncharacterized protein YggT (Ycf19 family)